MADEWNDGMTDEYYDAMVEADRDAQALVKLLPGWDAPNVLTLRSLLVDAGDFGLLAVGLREWAEREHPGRFDDLAIQQAAFKVLDWAAISRLRLHADACRDHDREAADLFERAADLWESHNKGQQQFIHDDRAKRLLDSSEE